MNATMLEGEMIRDACRWVTGRSRHVGIDERRLEAVCCEIDPGRLRLPDWHVAVVPHWHDERLAEFMLLFNSINFCYWTVRAPKWAVTWRGEQYDGAYGMMAALTRSLQDDDFDLLDGDTLARMTPSEFEHVMRGTAPIPLADERLSIWHEVGGVLRDEFGGRWIDVVKRAGGSAVGLVRLLVDRMPSWNDAAQYDGRQIPFLKRAQLAAGMIYEAFGGQGWGEFSDFQRLTVYSDYKLPQVLRRLGILVYHGTLAELIATQTLIPKGSRMEVEIRAATVWAGELLRQALASRAPGITAAHVDYWLWEMGQIKTPDDSPYHRTVTTAY